MKKILSIFLIGCLLSACNNKEIKNGGVTVDVPENITIENIEKLSTLVRPSARQLAYQQEEMLGFIHIGMNTYTNAEWGKGEESPQIFNPSNLNAEEWILTFKKAGINAVILVAKHHDGFCVWPSKYTEHSVKNSPWREGKGDLVKEVADACKKHNMKLCLYLSPWDMNASTYGTDTYNDYYIHQLEELLTNYGPVYLLWFDGAGIDSKTSGVEMPFDWERIFKRARELQPNILLSGAAPDVRWVGNEAGRGRETEWSVQGIDDMSELFGGLVKGHQPMAKDLGSLKELMTKKRLVWYPSRGGLPLRKGWFYNPKDDDTVKSLEYLVDSYFSTVGQNSNLLPNLSPNTLGQIPALDASRLIEFGSIITKMKSKDFAKGAKAVPLSSWEHYDESNLFDVDPFTSWNTKEGDKTGDIEIQLKRKSTFNVIKLQENVRDFGQRVAAFSIDAWVDNQWLEVGKSTTIGYRKMLRLKSPVTTDKLRIHILDSRVSISLGNLSLYYLPPIKKEQSQAAKNYLYKDNWTVYMAGMNKRQASSLLDIKNKEPFYFDFDSSYKDFIICLDQEGTVIQNLSYFPLSDQLDYGHIDRYEVYVSDDGKNWGVPILKDRFNNIENNPVEQVISIKKQRVKYLKLRVLSATKKKVAIRGFRFS